MSERPTVEQLRVEKEDANHRVSRLRKAATGLLVCWAIVATVGILSLALSDARDKKAVNKSTQALAQSTAALNRAYENTAAIQSQVLHGCVRLNVLRALDNSSHWADYQFITQQIQFTTSSLRSNFLALKHLGLSQSVLNRALRQSRASLISQRRQAAAKEWVPLTNCKAVVQTSGSSYLAPPPISFKHGPPPPSALSIRNAERLTPVGSVA